MRMNLRVIVLALYALTSVGACVGQAAPAAEPGPQRKTSEPYTGDLTIFDSPGPGLVPAIFLEWLFFWSGERQA